MKLNRQTLIASLLAVTNVLAVGTSTVFADDSTLAPTSAPVPQLEKETPEDDYSSVAPGPMQAVPPSNVYGSPQYGAPAQYRYGSPLWNGYSSSQTQYGSASPQYDENRSHFPSYGSSNFTYPGQYDGYRPGYSPGYNSGYPGQSGYGVNPGPVATAPTGLVIPITLRTAISTQVAKQGDFIEAAIAQNVSLGGMAYIPAGSVVTGQISESQAGRRLSRSGSLTIDFNQLQIANGGPSVPISAHLLGEIGKYKQDASGEMHGETWKAKLGQFALRSVLGAGLGAGLGTGIGAIGGGGYGAGMGAWSGAAIGGGIGAGDMLLRKGRDVLIRSGTAMRLELDEPVSIPAGANLSAFTEPTQQQGAF